MRAEQDFMVARNCFRITGFSVGSTLPVELASLYCYSNSLITVLISGRIPASRDPALN